MTLRKNFLIILTLSLLSISEGISSQVTPKASPASLTPSQKKKTAPSPATTTPQAASFYNNALPQGDKSLIDLFGPQTGLTQKTQDYWNKLKKENVCSTAACPRDRQIQCYRGIPENVDGCQDTQRIRLSEFVKKHIIGKQNAWSPNGVPGLEDIKKLPGVDQSATDASTSGRTSAALNNQGVTNNNPGSGSAAAAIGAAGIAAGVAAPGLNNDGTNVNTPDNGNAALGIGAAGIAAGLAAAGLNNDGTNVNPGGEGVAPPAPIPGPTTVPPVNPGATPNAKCTVDDIKQIGIDLAKEVSAINKKIKFTKAKYEALNQAKPNMQMTANLEILKNNLERLDALHRLIIQELKVALLEPDIGVKKGTLYITRGRLNIYHGKQKNIFPDNALKDIDQFCSCALSKTNPQEINQLILSLKEGIETQLPSVGN